jgi:hypothetical protein
VQENEILFVIIYPGDDFHNNIKKNIAQINNTPEKGAFMRYFITVTNIDMDTSPKLVLQHYPTEKVHDLSSSPEISYDNIRRSIRNLKKV